MQNAFAPLDQGPRTRLAPEMMPTGANAFADVSGGGGTPMPNQRGAAPRQPPTSGGSVPFTNAFADALAPPKPPGKLQQAVGAFFQGRAPEGYNQGLQMAQQRRTAQQEQVMGQVKAARNFLAQGAQLPPEQRAQWFAQNAAQIKAQTGQDPLQGEHDYSDASIKAGLAALDGVLGQSPAQAEPYTLAPGAQRYGADGRMIAENPRADRPEAAPRLQTEVGRNGNYWTFDPASGQMKDTGVPAPEKGNNGVNLTFGEGGALSGLSIGGSAPKGKEAAIVRGPDGQPIVTPGPQQAGANKAYQSLQDFRAQNDIVMDDIRKAKELIGPWTTGPGAALADLPIFGKSTDAGALESRINTIKANVGFDKLQNMRENSPTGGALGAVTEREIAFLQAVFGDLDTARRQEDVEYNLTRLEEFMKGREARLQAAFAQDYPDLAQYAGFAAGAQQQGRDLQSGAATMTATNPKTGERIQYNPETQQWEPVR